MKRPLDEPYFDWLCAKVTIGEGPTPAYYELLHILYDTEFVWIIVGDDNRAGDGRDLRVEFLRESRLGNDSVWFDVGCSILEMLIALSRRAEFQTEISSVEWFWKFLTNLNLTEFDDDSISYEAVSEILYNFVWRTYDYDGSGGLFPMSNPPEDQTGVEIWYQFSEYLVDQGM